jgi:hypothetical protein
VLGAVAAGAAAGDDLGAVAAEDLGGADLVVQGDVRDLLAKRLVVILSLRHWILLPITGEQRAEVRTLAGSAAKQLEHSLLAAGRFGVDWKAKEETSGYFCAKEWLREGFEDVIALNCVRPLAACAD